MVTASKTKKVQAQKHGAGMRFSARGTFTTKSQRMALVHILEKFDVIVKKTRRKLDLDCDLKVGTVFSASRCEWEFFLKVSNSDQWTSFLVALGMELNDLRSRTRLFYEAE